MQEHMQLDQVSGSVFDAASTTQKNQIGRKVTFTDGREFVYVATAADLAAGDVLVSTPNAQAITAGQIATTHAIGSEVLTITGAGVTLNEYAGGYLAVTSSTGVGYLYRVKSNTATASGVYTVTLKDALLVAVGTGTVGSLYVGLYDNVAQGGVAGVPVGVAVVPTTAATAGATQYFWIQTKGLAVVKRSGNLSAGDKISPAASGAAAVTAAHGSPVIGNSMVAETSATHFLAKINV